MEDPRKEGATKREEGKNNGRSNMGGEKIKVETEGFCEDREKKGKRVWVGNGRVKINE